MKKRILLFIIIVTGSCLIGGVLGFTYINSRIESDKDGLQKKLDDLLEGKVSICDGVKQVYTGSYIDNDMKHFRFETGGFSIFSITQESDGYVKTTTQSIDLVYTESIYVYDPPQYYNGWKLRDGTYRQSDRPRVQTCYDNAFEFLLKGNEENPNIAYSPDKITDIKNFPSGFESNYYKLEQHNHPSEFYWDYSGTGNVYTTAYQLNYSQEKSYFLLTKQPKEVLKSTIFSIIIGCLIGCGIGFAIVFFLQNRTPHKGEHDSILNIKWRSIKDNSILTIHPKTLGNYPVTLVFENKPKKGKAQIKDGTLELIFEDAEYYFKTDQPYQSVLLLTDLASKEQVFYEKLGSDAYQQFMRSVTVPPHSFS